MDHTVLWIGPVMLLIFGAAYGLVFAEGKIQLRKSKPLLVAGLTWILVAIAYHQQGRGPEVADKLRHVVQEYAELFLFLFAAMSFVNALVERNVFEFLRTQLAFRWLSVRDLFWITGGVAFVLSPVLDNLTTALVLGTVVLAALQYQKHMIGPALINIVVASNAGGVFSPFGDITTLMVWQKGLVPFSYFLLLFIPAVVNWIIPAAILGSTLPTDKVTASYEQVEVRRGGFVILALFIGTIMATVLFNHLLHLPPFLIMMMGFGGLKLYGYFLNLWEMKLEEKAAGKTSAVVTRDDGWALHKPFDIFNILEKIEWDTLLFFYGVILCVGALEAIGYLSGLSAFLYKGMGNTITNILIGLLSAVVDNIPLMAAVLEMNPAMDQGQWLLVTLTTGVGGSLLSIGSAAGIALMGLARGSYTFREHLRWTWAIGLGFIASVVVHFVANWWVFG